MVGLVQSGRLDDIGVLHSIDQVSEGYAGVLQARQVGNDVELGNLAALHGHGADAGDAVQRRLEIIGGDLPEARGEWFGPRSSAVSA